MTLVGADLPARAHDFLKFTTLSILDDDTTSAPNETDLSEKADEHGDSAEMEGN